MKPIRFNTSGWSAAYAAEVIAEWLSGYGAKILSQTSERIEFQGRRWSGDLTGQLRGTIRIQRDGPAFSVISKIDRTALRYTAAIPVFGLLILSFLFSTLEEWTRFAVFAPLLWGFFYLGQGCLKTRLLRYSLKAHLEEREAMIERPASEITTPS